MPRPTSSFMRVSLLSMLLMPLCFAAGWFARGWNYESEVEEGVYQIIAPLRDGDQIEFVPQLGGYLPPLAWVERQNQLIENRNPDEVQRRMEFFNRLRSGGFGGESSFGPQSQGGFPGR